MRVNLNITVVAGTPINVITGTSTAPSADSEPVYATRVFVQMLHGGSGIGYVMDGIAVGRVPSSSTAGDVTAELSPAQTINGVQVPGGDYSDWDQNVGGGIDMRKIWIDGGNSGDLIKVSYDRKV